MGCGSWGWRVLGVSTGSRSPTRAVAEAVGGVAVSDEFHPLGNVDPFEFELAPGHVDGTAPGASNSERAAWAAPGGAFQP